MTEMEWLTCEDPRPRAEYLFARARPRKLRLWACACGRDLISLFDNPLIGDVLDRFESVAEGDQSRDDQQRPLSELQWAVNEERSAGFSRAVAGIAHSQWIEMAQGYEGHFALGLLHLAAAQADSACPTAEAEGPIGTHTDPSRRSVDSAARQRQSALARDIFGNPFRPVMLATGCLTVDVVVLAQAAYQERQMPSGELDPQRLALLADALEEAGCTDRAILDHLRSPGSHVRGCFVVDLVLAKE